MRLILGLVALSTAIGATSPVSAQVKVEELEAITACVQGRVWVWGGKEPIPATLLGPGKAAGSCMVLAEDYILQGPVEAEFGTISAVKAPGLPDPRMVELGRTAVLNDSQYRQMRAMAENNHYDARIFLARYELTANDSNIVARICNVDWNTHICAHANEDFHKGVTANNRAIDARNAQAEAVERQARANSEPVNSGYYSSGASSSSAPYKPSSGTTTSAGPVTGVQSESSIRRDQARCRANSGPC